MFKDSSNSLEERCRERQPLAPASRRVLTAGSGWAENHDAGVGECSSEGTDSIRLPLKKLPVKEQKIWVM
jgi:hypothetical protein